MQEFAIELTIFDHSIFKTNDFQLFIHESFQFYFPELMERDCRLEEKMRYVPS